MMDTDCNPEAPAEKLAWVTPRLDQLGTVDDINADGAQPPNDGSGSPSNVAS